MSFLDLTPQLLLMSLGVAGVGGLVLLLMSKKVPNQTTLYFNLVLFLIVAVFLSLSLKSIAMNHFEPRIWVRGWILPRGEVGSIQLGSLESVFSLVTSLLFCALAVAAAFFTKVSVLKQHQKNLFFGSLTLSVSGAIIALVSATPFTLVLGLVYCLVGVYFTSFGFSGVAEDSYFAIRLPRNQAIGIICILLGLIALSASPTSVLAGILLVAGIFVLCGAFPVMGSSSELASIPLSHRFFQGLLFPSMIAYVLLVRQSSSLAELGILPPLEYAALVLCFMSAFCGTLQSRAKESLLHWLSSAMLLGLAIASFLDFAKSFSWVLSTILSGVSFLFLTDIFSYDSQEEDQSSSKATVAKIGLFLSGICGSGMIGFVGALGLTEFASYSIGTPLLAGVFGAAWLFLSILLWKIVFILSKTKVRPHITWFSVSAPIVLSIIGLGVFWSGCLSGTLLPGAPDRVIGSAFEFFFGNFDSGLQYAAFGLSYGILLLAIILSYLGWASGTPIQLKLEKSYPRVIRVLRNGLGADDGFKFLIRLLVLAAEIISHWVDEKISNEYVPHGLGVIFGKIGRLAEKINDVISENLDHTVRIISDVPGKGLQLVQSGNLQWYLVFAIGSGLAMLLHFLRN